jgi:hypothetical protein
VQTNKNTYSNTNNYTTDAAADSNLMVGGCKNVPSVRHVGDVRSALISAWKRVEEANIIEIGLVMPLLGLIKTMGMDEDVSGFNERIEATFSEYPEINQPLERIRCPLGSGSLVGNLNSENHHHHHMQGDHDEIR